MKIWYIPVLWAVFMIGMIFGASTAPKPTADEQTVAECYKNGFEAGRLVAYHDSVKEPLDGEETFLINDGKRLCVNYDSR